MDEAMYWLLVGILDSLNTASAVLFIGEWGLIGSWYLQLPIKHWNSVDIVEPHDMTAFTVIFFRGSTNLI